MAITRERVSRYRTSDGKTWDVHAEAIQWEKRYVLLLLLRKSFPEASLSQLSSGLEAILKSPHLIVALAGSGTNPPPRQQELLP